LNLLPKSKWPRQIICIPRVTLQNIHHNFFVYWHNLWSLTLAAFWQWGAEWFAWVRCQLGKPLTVLLALSKCRSSWHFGLVALLCRLIDSFIKSIYVYIYLIQYIYIWYLPEEGGGGFSVFFIDKNNNLCGYDWQASASGDDKACKDSWCICQIHVLLVLGKRPPPFFGVVEEGVVFAEVSGNRQIN